MFCGNAEKVVQRNFVRTQDCVGNYGEIVNILLEENKVLKKKNKQLQFSYEMLKTRMEICMKAVRTKDATTAKTMEKAIATNAHEEESFRDINL